MILQINNNGYVQICKNISKFLTKYSEIHACDCLSSNWSFSFALDIPKQKSNIDCGVYTCIYSLSLANRLQSVAARSLLTARHYIAMIALKFALEKCKSTRLALDETVGINKQKLLDSERRFTGIIKERNHWDNFRRTLDCKKTKQQIEK